MARRVSYGDLTATDVTTVAGTQYKEDSLEGGGNGTEVVYHNMDTSVTDSGSEDGDRSFDKADKNAFIDDIANEVSGDSGAEDALQGESEVGDVTICDVGDWADSLELYLMHDRSVRVAGQSESTTKPVVRRASSHAKVKTEKGLYIDMHPSSSLTPNKLVQYAVDVAHAVVSLPAVYLEDLDGLPLPSRSSGAHSRSQPKHNPSASLAQLPIHTSLGSLLIGDGVVPAPVKTLGTSKSRMLMSLQALYAQNLQILQPSPYTNSSFIQLLPPKQTPDLISSSVSKYLRTLTGYTVIIQP
ncbi:hypothetical protein IW261DRAFT_1563603 [Armillaria novae-zelandiae]|uniref:Uncharacterized protein n=1 Tax=Armillaria novae-zelandiae TaxID=153914 RepID=A0AA39TD00_9AGAR|nr:hypothetical protein IW261DRAFT_1563603 [Armillaria novae-zelandiae]